MEHIFVSYAHKDRDFAEIIINRLKQEQIASWIDSEKLRAGKDWQEQIDNGLRESFLVLLIVTPNAKSSEYVTYEWSFAIGAGKVVIPIIREKTDIHSRLANVQYFDFSGQYRPFDDLIAEIKRVKIEIKSNESKELTNSNAQSVQYDVASVIKDLESEDFDAQIGAALVLGKLKEIAALNPLVKLLNSERKNVVKVAVDTLGEIGAKSVVPKLVAKLYSMTYSVSYERDRWGDTDENIDIICALIKALGKLGDELAFDAIYARFTNHEARYGNGYNIVQHAINALISINPSKSLSLLMKDARYLHEYDKAKVHTILFTLQSNGNDTFSKAVSTFMKQFPEYLQDMDDIPF